MSKLTIFWTAAVGGFVPAGETTEEVDADSLCFPGGRLVCYTTVGGDKIAISTAVIEKVVLTP